MPLPREAEVEVEVERGGVCVCSEGRARGLAGGLHEGRIWTSSLVNSRAFTEMEKLERSWMRPES